MKHFKKFSMYNENEETTASDSTMKQDSDTPKEEKKYPDFPQWIESEEGKGCLRLPISEVQYLHNRLFWAFDAGRNCVWQQYMRQKEELQQRDETIKELKNAMKQSSELYANLKFDDEPFTPYQLALQEIKELKAFLKEMVEYSNFPGANYTIPSVWYAKAKKLIE